MRRPTAAFWVELQKIDQQLNGSDYYQLLGCARDADVEELRERYERQVRVLHPDRHVRETDPERQKCLTRIYARIGEAFRVLSHPHNRAKYDLALRDGETRFEEGRSDKNPRPERDPNNPQARSLLEQAQALIASNDRRAARAKLQLAKQYEPGSKAIEEALASCGQATPAPPADAPVATTAPKEVVPSPAPSPIPTPVRKAPSAPVRAHPRVPMGQLIRIGCTEWEQVKTFYMHNISRGGMLLRCKQTIPIGSIIDLTIVTPDREDIELPAEVVRHVAPEGPGKRPGVGVRFLLIPDAVRDRFEVLLRVAGVETSSEEEPAEAIRKGPEEQAVEDAEALIVAGEYQAACKLLQGPVRAFPDNKVLRGSFHLAAGMMARARSQEVAAHTHFERALRYDPDSPLILEALREDPK